jgi:hypothetical protein
LTLHPPHAPTDFLVCRLAARFSPVGRKADLGVRRLAAALLFAQLAAPGSATNPVDAANRESNNVIVNLEWVVWP